MTTANKSEKDRVIVFDTTLRDGEQCPGATMTFEEKIEIAEMLDDMGVDVIEAGFPITSAILTAKRTSTGYCTPGPCKGLSVYGKA